MDGGGGAPVVVGGGSSMESIGERELKERADREGVWAAKGFLRQP